MISDPTIAHKMAQMNAGYKMDYSPSRRDGKLVRDRFGNIEKVLEPGDPSREIRVIVYDLTTNQNYPESTWGYGATEESAVRDAIHKAIEGEKPLTPAQKLDAAKHAGVRARLEAVLAERDRLRAQLAAAGMEVAAEASASPEALEQLNRVADANPAPAAPAPPPDIRADTIRAMFLAFEGNTRAAEYLAGALADQTVTVEDAAKFIKEHLAKKTRNVWTGNKEDGTHEV